jgi:hypothetical protein
METFFTVSLNGKFVFRTDIILNGSEGELAKVEATLRLLRASGENYRITRTERPAFWQSTEVA